MGGKNAVGNFLWEKTSLGHISAIIEAPQTFDSQGLHRH